MQVLGTGSRLIKPSDLGISRKGYSVTQYFSWIENYEITELGFLDPDTQLRIFLLLMIRKKDHKER